MLASVDAPNRNEAVPAAPPSFPRQARRLRYGFTRLKLSRQRRVFPEADREIGAPR